MAAGSRVSCVAAILMLRAGALAAQQSCPAAKPGDLPLKYAGAPTVAAITPCDLMTRLYQFADDSFLGRAVGTTANVRATDYLEREARRIGLLPAGDSGTFRQAVPVIVRAFDTTSTITVSGKTYHGGTDFLMQTVGRLHQLDNLVAMYGGAVYDTLTTLTPEMVRGKLLVLRAGGFQPTLAFLQSNGYRRWVQMAGAAAATANFGSPTIPAALVTNSLRPAAPMRPPIVDRQVALLITTTLADALLGRPAPEVAVGATGEAITTAFRVSDTPVPAYNIVGVIPGSDPMLRNEYGIVGAHSDHLSPFDRREHDSVRVFNQQFRPQGARSPAVVPNEPNVARIRAALDSVRKVNPARTDSIYNGADDSGSGVVSSLEIAEAFMGAATRPKRSVLFVWHNGQEPGEWGSTYFTAHPTIPIDSAVAYLNLNSLGRGAASDVTGRAPDGTLLHGNESYLQVIGGRRQSLELGDLLDRVNADHAVSLDLSVDAAGAPEKLSCIDDRPPYEAHGVPALWFTTGSNADFHQVR